MVQTVFLAITETGLFLGWLYPFPLQFLSKYSLYHWTNSKLSWNLPFTSLSTGMIWKKKYHKPANLM
jgi:hypothetical protein